MRPEHELVHDWLQRAHLDLRSAEVLLNADPPLTQDSGYHSQQAVEKSLKGYLVHHGVEYEWTHEIERLLRQCGDIDKDFLALTDTASELTDYAVRFRYPVPESALTAEQVRPILEVARRVYQFVLDHLPPETHPKD